MLPELAGPCAEIISAQTSPRAGLLQVQARDADLRGRYFRVHGAQAEVSSLGQGYSGAFGNDTIGRVSREDAPVTHDAAAIITGLVVGGRAYGFVSDDAGEVVATTGPRRSVATAEEQRLAV